MQELLQDYPVVIEIPVAWGEMDAFQHVNNTVYFRYMESGRIAYFERIGFPSLKVEGDVGPVVAEANCRFRRPLTYPDTVSVGVRVGQIDEDRFVMGHRIVSHKLEAVAAEGEAVVVLFDFAAQRKAPLPDLLRQRIEALERHKGR